MNDILTKIESYRGRTGLKLVCGLKNSDSEGVLLKLLKNEPQKIFEGMSLAAKLLNTPEKIMYIPEYAEKYAEKITVSATEHGIHIKIGLIDVYRHRGDFICHLVEMYRLPQIIHGDLPATVFVSVNGGELINGDANTPLSDLITDIQYVKAVITGSHVYGKDAVQMSIGDFHSENGSIRIFTDRDCLVHEISQIISVFRVRCCGKCVFCREGLMQFDLLHKEILQGKGKAEHLNIMTEIASALINSGKCSLGRDAAEIVSDALKVFSEEYNDHIRKKCPAGKCFSKELYYINPKTCAGCGDCADVCPVGCIDGKSNYIHMIDMMDCTSCGKCAEVCGTGSIEKTGGKLPKLPDRLVKCGKFMRH